MSHVILIEPERDYQLDRLKLMCDLSGWEMIKSKTYQWYGRHVGDYPIPTGLTKEEIGTCDYEIKVPCCGYSIGVKSKDGKIYLLYDFWSGGKGLEKALGGRNGTNLLRNYDTACIVAQAKKERRRIKKTETPKEIGRGRRLVIDME